MHRPSWLAPTGELHYCSSGGHLKLAEHLVKELLGLEDCYNPELSIEKLGWLKISSKGSVLVFTAETITPAQVDTLFSLLTCEHGPQPLASESTEASQGTVESWREGIKKAIEYFDGRVYAPAA